MDFSNLHELMGGAAIQLTVDLLAAHANEGASDVELRQIGHLIEGIEAQPCTHKIAEGAYGRVYNICAVNPCATCFAIKIPIGEFDIDVGEFRIQQQLYNAFVGSTFGAWGTEYDLTLLVPKPLAYIKFISSGIAGGAFSRSAYSRSRSRGQRDREDNGFGMPAARVTPVAPLSPSPFAPIAPAPPVPAAPIPFLLPISSASLPFLPLVRLPFPSALLPSPPLPPVPIRYRHAMISGVLLGTTAHEILVSDTVTSADVLNIMRRVFIFVNEAVRRVEGFQHNDLHTKNIKVHESTVSILDFGMSNTVLEDHVHTEGQRALKPYGNWDCWKFLGHITNHLLRHAIAKRHEWALPIIKSIREFLENDMAFCYFVPTQNLNNASVRRTLAWGGKPIELPELRGCDSYFMPVFVDRGHVHVLPDFPDFQRRFPPSRFVAHFLKP